MLGLNREMLCIHACTAGTENKAACIVYMPLPSQCTHSSHSSSKRLVGCHMVI